MTGDELRDLLIEAASDLPAPDDPMTEVEAAIDRRRRNRTRTVGAIAAAAALVLVVVVIGAGRTGSTIVDATSAPSSDPPSTIECTPPSPRSTQVPPPLPEPVSAARVEILTAAHDCNWAALTNQMADPFRVDRNAGPMTKADAVAALSTVDRSTFVEQLTRALSTGTTATETDDGGRTIAWTWTTSTVEGAVPAIRVAINVEGEWIAAEVTIDDTATSLTSPAPSEARSTITRQQAIDRVRQLSQVTNVGMIEAKLSTDGVSFDQESGSIATRPPGLTWYVAVKGEITTSFGHGLPMTWAIYAIDAGTGTVIGTSAGTTPDWPKQYLDLIDES